MSENAVRALKGFIINRIIEYRKMFLIFVLSIFSISTIDLMAMILYKAIFPERVFYFGIGALTYGFGALCFVLPLALFVTALRSNTNMKLIRPLSRILMTAGGFIVNTIMIAALLICISVAALAELAVCKAFSALSNGVVSVNFISADNFIVGFWVSLCYLTLFASMSYCAAMLFNRSIKAATAIVIGLISLFAAVPWVFDALCAFFATEQSVAVFSLKSWLAAVVLYLAGYMRLRKYEVMV